MDVVNNVPILNREEVFCYSKVFSLRPDAAPDKSLMNVQYYQSYFARFSLFAVVKAVLFLFDFEDSISFRLEVCLNNLKID